MKAGNEKIDEAYMSRSASVACVSVVAQSSSTLERARAAMQMHNTAYAWYISSR